MTSAPWQPCTLEERASQTCSTGGREREGNSDEKTVD